MVTIVRENSYARRPPRLLSRNPETACEPLSRSMNTHADSAEPRAGFALERSPNPTAQNRSRCEASSTNSLMDLGRRSRATGRPDRRADAAMVAARVCSGVVLTPQECPKVPAPGEATAGVGPRPIPAQATCRRGIGEHQLVELAEAVDDLTSVKPDPSVQTILDLGRDLAAARLRFCHLGRAVAGRRDGRVLWSRRPKESRR
jgi:hypothetical protein